MSHHHAGCVARANRQGTPPAILDVRTGREFANGHVPGATHVPFWQVSKRLAAIPASKHDELIVYLRAWTSCADRRTQPA